MHDLQRSGQSGFIRVFVASLTLPVLLSGCAAQEYRELRWEGQRMMLNSMHGSARCLFEQAEELRPRRVQNLHDLGACSVMLARQRFEQMNHAAAMRELDAAIAYYSQAIEVHPGHQASIEGTNIALELKGQFDEALKHAEWAAEFVGPSAAQYIFLAKELEERGDVDGALLRYRQAVAMESANPDAHVAFAKFLLRSKNEPAAIHHLQAAYRLNPADDWVVDQLTARSALPPLASSSGSGP
ncbi:MAG: tetratricopeptide repeat protein [Phycisphaerae bacterium]